MKQHEIILNDTWIKASIIGTTWAASEIVLGSFLHNLKIPFSGNVLTAIGIIILISVSFIWKEKGLYWRAGLICAVMKTMSPSAVIFGPMIAIFSQSLLLEISVRLFGKTYIGFTVGAMLAMSWNLFQKIINFIIFYGMSIVKVYESLLETAQKQLHIKADIVWLPIIILLIVYCILGIIAAVIGMKTGRKFAESPNGFKPFKSASDNVNIPKNNKQQFNYSLVWLLMDIILMVGGLFLIKNSHWGIWSSAITVIVFIFTLRYKRAMRQLLKLKFWIFLVIITMVTTFVFTKIQGNSLEQGLLIGFEMNFRAIIIILGFSALGTELYNPKIQAVFLKTSFKQLPLALELSFESLPMMIASIPDVKTVLKNPVSIIYGVISQADHRLKEIKKKQMFKQQVLIISGALSEGKTTIIKAISSKLKANRFSVGGFYSPRIIKGNDTVGYNLVEIQTEKEINFLNVEGSNPNGKIGKFNIIEEGLQKGREMLQPSNNENIDIIVIDEVGRLELKDMGWAQNVKQLLKHNKQHLILAVRKDFVEDVLKKWDIKNHEVFQISAMTPEQISKTIIRKLIQEKQNDS